MLFYLTPFLVVLAELFIFCYYGNQLTSKVYGGEYNLLDILYYICSKGNEVLLCIGDTNWNEFPMDCQKCVGLMMLRMQQPIILTGCGIFPCDYPTFVEVSVFIRDYITMALTYLDRIVGSTYGRIGCGSVSEH